MAATTPNEAKISLKLMVHKEKKRVIFAEADNHFVDILFSFMALPLGTIVRLLEKIPDQKVKALGSLQNLYQSLIDLPENTLSTEESKLMMLNPRSSHSSENGDIIKIGLVCEKDLQSKRMRLKVTLQKSKSKFLFAEVEREFVDFLFGFLEIPLGTVVGKLMNGNSSVVSLDNLFASMASMDVGYIKSQGLKDVLLQPQMAWNYVSQNEIFSVNVSKGSQVYCRSNVPHYYNHNKASYAYLTNYTTAFYTEDEKWQAITFKDPRSHGSLLKPLVRLMLTDDLAVTPISSISTISMLNKLKVPLNDIEEQEVNVGIEEGLRILKASLKSPLPLSDALLKGNNQNF
ncbi:hypothetical protein Tco_1059716 [Tanacetum coccineum]